MNKSVGGVRRLRVVLIALHFAEYSYRLARALAEHHDVLLLLAKQNATDELGAALHETNESLTISLFSAGQGLKAVWNDARGIADLVSAHRPDVIHCQEAITPALMLAMLRLRRYPLVVTSHDPTPHSGEEVRSLSALRRVLMLQRWRNTADVAITHGEVLKQQLVAAYPRLEGKVYSVPHGPLGGPRATAPSDCGNFLFFGRIQQYKGLGYFVDALLQLHEQEGLPVKGVIAGRGPDLEPYRARIANHPAFEIHERFIREDELPGFFARAQAVVLPYTDGTQSGVAAMALGYGRPVVSTRVGAVQEMVRDGENGLLVPPRDATALAAALRRLMQELGLAAEMGERSHALGQGALSWARNAEISSDAYERAIKLRRR